MNQATILKKIENNELTALEAYEILYPEETTKIGKRAHFVKMRVSIPDEGKGVNTLLKVLFALPIPIVFARIALRFSKRLVKNDEIDLDSIANLIKYSRHSKVSVEASDAIVDFKIM